MLFKRTLLYSHYFKHLISSELSYICFADMDTDLEITKVMNIVHGVIELRSDNILSFRPDAATFKNYDHKVLSDLLEAFIEITEGIPRPYLCDNSYVSGIVNKEELAYMNENFGRFATHAAMITSSNLIRVLLNSYNTLFKPKVELRLFNSEKKAVEWLLSK